MNQLQASSMKQPQTQDQRISMANTQLGKPSLKLLLAQQMVKPDPTAKSPPITSNCQSESSLVVTTHTRNSPKSSLSNNTNRQKTRNIQNSLGTLLQQTTNMFAKQQHQQQMMVASQANKQSKSQNVSQQYQFPKARKSTASTSNNVNLLNNTKTLQHLPMANRLQQQTNNIQPQTNCANKYNQQETSKRAGDDYLRSNEQPRVGKQLNDMMMMSDARPSMTGDIDDVANLVTPSPRRNPGKVQQLQQQLQKQQHQHQTVTLDHRRQFKDEANETAESHIVTEESQLMAIDIDLQVQQLQPLVLDSCDESMSLPVNEFNSHLVTPQLSTTSAEQTKNNKLFSQPFNVKQMMHITAPPSSSQKQQKLSTNLQKKESSMVQRQVPLQSSIETKKATNKHPNAKVMASIKPFMNQKPANSRVYEQSASTIAKQTKQFPVRNTRQQKALKDKDSMKQSCDVIVSTDGNISEFNDRIEERRTIGLVQKSALAVFGPANTSPATEIEKAQLASFSKSCFTSAASKKVIKPLVPKQIEIELGFEKGKLAQTQTNTSKSSQLLNKQAVAASKRQQPKAASSTILDKTDGGQAFLLNSFPINNRGEIPLEERPPNSANQQQLGLPTKADMSLKNKCRQKIMNQTVVEKQSTKAQTGTKIQAIPTLNLHSFKSRPMAPVTSRNMSNAASMVKSKKDNSNTNSLGGRNPNFKRAAVKDSALCESSKSQQGIADISPLTMETKTMESLATPADHKTKGLLTLTAKVNQSATSSNVGAIALSGQQKKLKSSISSSVDARRQFHHQVRKPVSQTRCDDFSGAISREQKGQNQKVSQANISIDLTTKNLNNDQGSLQRSSNAQYKTESLERILGSQAESYFRQIERTIQIGPVNVAQTQNRSQRQASLSVSSHRSCKTGKDSSSHQQQQPISLSMPGIAECSGFSQSIGKSSTISGIKNNSKNKLIHGVHRLEPRLASADKKSTFEITKVNTSSSLSQGGKYDMVRPGAGIFNRDRLVAHRKIDLICDDTVDSSASMLSKGGSLSASMLKDGPNASKNLATSSSNRKKSESVSSANDSQAVIASKMNSFGTQQMTAKPGSTGRRTQVLMSTTRNSKSSFGSNSRMQNSSKQSIVKDWVMCLPNEPPKVIEQHTEEILMLPIQKTKDRKSEKKDNSIVHTEVSNSTRGGKSLLHPSAQKKVQARKQNVASSRESADNSDLSQQITLVRRSQANKQALQNAVSSASKSDIMSNKGASRKQPIEKKLKQGSIVVAKQSSQVITSQSKRKVIPHSQRSTSSLQLTHQNSQHSQMQALVVNDKLIVDQAAASYHNLSSANIVDAQSRRPKSRQSATLHSHKDQTDSQKSLIINTQPQNNLSVVHQHSSSIIKQEPSFKDKSDKKSCQQQQSLIVDQNKEPHTMRSSLNQKTERSNHDLLFVTTDDEATQYYEKLTSLFQETRQKLKEFNNDFENRNARSDQKQVRAVYTKPANRQSLNDQQHYHAKHSPVASVDDQRSSFNARESLQINLRHSESGLSSQNYRKTGKSSNWGSMVEQSRRMDQDEGNRRQRDHNHRKGNHRPQHTEKEKAKGSSRGLLKQRSDVQQKESDVKPKLKQKITSPNHSEPKRRESIPKIQSGMKDDQSLIIDDNYYQVNNDSIDFMVNSRTQLKKKESNRHKGKDSQTYLKEPKNENQSNRNAKPQQDQQANPEKKQPSTRHRRNNNNELQKAHTQEDRRENQQLQYAQNNAVNQPQMPTNATIYINNLMNGVSQQVTDDHLNILHQQALIQEMQRTQSQVMYPQTQYHPQHGSMGHQPMIGNPMQLMPHQQPPQQQQIVFVPVPVIQSNQNPIPQVSSAPAFMPSPHSHLPYQFPQQSSGPLFQHQVQQQHSPMYANHHPMQPQQQQQQQQYTTMIDFRSTNTAYTNMQHQQPQQTNYVHHQQQAFYSHQKHQQVKKSAAPNHQSSKPQNNGKSSHTSNTAQVKQQRQNNKETATQNCQNCKDTTGKQSKQ